MVKSSEDEPVLPCALVTLADTVRSPLPSAVNWLSVTAGQTLTGKVSNAASGDTVTIILGGQTYTATVHSDDRQRAVHQHIVRG
jgi:hypothetical protein